MVQRGLESVPCTKVKYVKDGQEAIDYLEGREQYGDRKAFPLPHIILLDLKMPRISGFEFLLWRRDEASDELSMIPVVILSGSDLEEDVKKAYVLGANRYLTKTPDIALFSRRMRQM